MSAQHTPGPEYKTAPERLRELNADLLAGVGMLLDAASPNMTHRNAKERDAYAKLRAAIAKAGGVYVDCGECPRISTGCKDRCAKAVGAS